MNYSKSIQPEICLPKNVINDKLTFDQVMAE